MGQCVAERIKRRESSNVFQVPLSPHHLPLRLQCICPPLGFSSVLHIHTFLPHTHITMSLNKVNRVSTSSVNGLNHCRTNGSRFSQDQNEPRVNEYVSLFVDSQGSRPANRQTLMLLCLGSIPAGSKSDGCPQSRDSKTGGL